MSRPFVIGFALVLAITAAGCLTGCDTRYVWREPGLFASLDRPLSPPNETAVVTLANEALTQRWHGFAVHWLQWEAPHTEEDINGTRIAPWFVLASDNGSFQLRAAGTRIQDRSAWEAALERFLDNTGLADVRPRLPPAPDEQGWNATLDAPGNVTALVARLDPARAEEWLDGATTRSLVWDDADGPWRLQLALAHKAVPLDDAGHELRIAADDRVGFGDAVPDHRSELQMQSWLRRHMADAGLPRPSFQEWHSIHEC